MAFGNRRLAAYEANNGFLLAIRDAFSTQRLLGTAPEVPDAIAERFSGLVRAYRKLKEAGTASQRTDRLFLLAGATSLSDYDYGKHLDQPPTGRIVGLAHFVLGRTIDGSMSGNIAEYWIPDGAFSNDTRGCNAAIASMALTNYRLTAETNTETRSTHFLTTSHNPQLVDDMRNQPGYRTLAMPEELTSVLWFPSADLHSVPATRESPYVPEIPNCHE